MTRSPATSSIPSRQRAEKDLDLGRVNDGLFEAVLRIEDRVGFVTILVEPGPRHLLFASPGDADRASRSVPGHIHVVAAPRSRFRIAPGRHVPPLAGLD